MKYNLIKYLIIILMPFLTFGCKDDLLFDESDYGEGEGSITATLTLTNVPANLSTRAAEPKPVEGGTAGNAIENIYSLCVLLYDTKGNFIEKFTEDKDKGLHELDEYKAELTDQTSPSDAIDDNDDHEHQAQAKTMRATFSLGKPAKKFPYGAYHIYAVANMGDLNGKNYQTEEDLKKIILQWDAAHIANNNQMFGYFTSKGNEKSEGFGPELVAVKAPVTEIHSWIKRAVSKVTIAFDGRNLKENVTIYLKSAKIVDIPSKCYLGADNPETPSDVEGSQGSEVTYAEATQTFVYGTGEDYGENWAARIAKGRPVYGCDTEALKDVNLTWEEKLKAQHKETTNAFYFYENLQGKGKTGTASDKRQDVSGNNAVISYPDGGKGEGNEGWKDAKKWGSYIEVEAYYISQNPGDATRGSIIYRFMLGKDTHLDYNCERNYHYKLTLKFNGYANDVDWHIDYNREQRDIEAPNPYYISYLYNHSMMMPLKVKTGKATITKITAEILENGWAPITDRPGMDVYPLNATNAPEYYDKYFLYYNGNGVTNSKTYAFNGFLSLRPTKKTVITGPYPLSMTSNKAYYNEDPKRGYVEYTGEQLNTPADKTFNECINEGVPHIVRGSSESGNIYDVNIPMWTRAKQLIKQTGFTGNNPYVAYQRLAKVRISITLSDGRVITTGIKTDGSNPKEEPINIKQVRRIVNPKGIWRSADNQQSFHVVLKILPNEEATSFEPLESDGPWRAYILRNEDGAIELEGSANTSTGTYQYTDKNGTTETFPTIEGKTRSNIDFTVKFPKTATDENPNYALIRVEYNNYSCYHLIFVRQGYGKPDNLLDGGVEWYTGNNITKDQIASNPLDEGSMFKFGNWNQPIAASNNVNGKSPWINIVPDDFKKNKAPTMFNLAGGGTASWNNITSQPYTTGRFDPPSSEMRVAKYEDYLALYNSPDIEMGFGVLYGDGAEETATNINDAYGHMGSSGDSKGMRGCFVYNYKTGKNIFFPIGASGYGHRKHALSVDGATYSGVLRYSCNPRWGYFNAYGDNYPQGVADAPLFFDIFRRPGAIYWLESNHAANAIEQGGEKNNVGWDFNYFTFDFFPISQSNIFNNDDDKSDAIFIRCVKD